MHFPRLGASPDHLQTLSRWSWQLCLKNVFRLLQYYTKDVHDRCMRSRARKSGCIGNGQVRANVTTTACVRDSARWQCARGMAVWEGGSASGVRGCQGGEVARGHGRSCDGRWVSDGAMRGVKVRVPCKAAWVPGWARRYEGEEGEAVRGRVCPSSGMGE